MGSLTGRPQIPRLPEKDWKPHSTLQWCFEQLQYFSTMGELKLEQVNNRYYMTLKLSNSVIYAANKIELCNCLHAIQHEINMSKIQ